MSKTVSSAFSTFRLLHVDLGTDETATARRSRDFLITNLNRLDGTVIGFPKLTGSSLSFGSFARRTKISPLNDIDFFIVLDGTGTSEHTPATPYQNWLKMTDATKPLASFLDSAGYVSSTKVLNKISSSLSTLHHYKSSGIKRTQQAVTVNLTSYDWTFDVVPAVAMYSQSIYGQSNTLLHYLIPDGKGEWMKTDPRKDAQSMTAANTRNGGYLLPIMRLLKYWNNRTANKSRLSSYYFETLALKTFSTAYSLSSLQSGIKHFFDYAPGYLYLNCPDPKGLGPNLDANVSYDTKQKIAVAMSTAATNAGYAIMYEGQGDIVNAIYWWKQVFGANFPDYG